MARRQKFLAARWAPRFAESYAALPPDRQERCDEPAMALIKGHTLPGLPVKPIQPDKYYSEARINSGDRIIFRIEADEIEFIDVVSSTTTSTGTAASRNRGDEGLRRSL